VKRHWIRTTMAIFALFAMLTMSACCQTEVVPTARSGMVQPGLAPSFIAFWLHVAGPPSPFF
jgi:hypothetical protein